jgi:cell division protein FtsX
LITLQKQKATLQSKVSKLSKDKNSLSDKLIETVKKTKQHREKREAIERSFKKIEEVNDNDRYLMRNQRLLTIPSI